LAVLGQIRAAQCKLEEAADFYRRAIAVIPPLPEYAAALGDVYTELGRFDDARQQHQLVEFIARLNKLNQVLYYRVLVDYYADLDLEHQQAVDLATASTRYGATSTARTQWPGRFIGTARLKPPFRTSSRP
jgi:tetratricopeptide (TPR) repeat protein